MTSYSEHKEIQKFNFENRDKSKACPDCSGQLQPQYYGYSCTDCGQLLTWKLERIKPKDLF